MSFTDGNILYAAELNALSNQVTAAQAAAETAAAGGTFTASGTGAVSRTVTSKLRDVVSVKDFGAVGDGTTNDTAAIQAALDAAATFSVGKLGRGMTVFFPDARYYVSSLTIRKPMNLIGFGPQAVDLLQVPSTAAPLITLAVQSDGTDYTLAGHPSPVVQIMGMRLTGGDLTYAGGVGIQHGIEFDDAVTNPIRYVVTLRDMIIRNMAGSALYGASATCGFACFNVSSTACEYGMSMNSMRDVSLVECNFGVSRKRGVTMSGCIKFTFTDCDVFSNAEEGIYIFGTNTTQHVFTSLKCDRNALHGLKLDNRAGHDVQIQGGIFEQNGSAIDGTYSEIRVENTAVGLTTLTNVWFDGTNAQVPARYALYNIEFGGTSPRVQVGVGVRGYDGTISTNQPAQVIAYNTQRLGIGTTTPVELIHTVGGSIRIEHTAPALKHYESDGGVNAKLWYIDVDSGEMRLRLMSDDALSAGRALTVTRSGITMGSLFLGGTSTTGAGCRVGGDSTWTNRLSMDGGATGSGVTLSTEGTVDADVHMRISAKGAGQVRVKLPGPYANDAAAAAGGLSVGDVYRVTATGAVVWRVV